MRMAGGQQYAVVKLSNISKCGHNSGPRFLRPILKRIQLTRYRVSNVVSCCSSTSGSATFLNGTECTLSSSTRLLLVLNTSVSNASNTALV